MKVLVAMSGGVDSSVAAAMALDAGHEVSGVTMKLWGGESDSGCCSVADVEDARRVAQQLGIDFHVFNFGDDFAEHVVAPYVAAWAGGSTPNPCVECNRHLKFDRLLRRADALGFDAVATGHHARIARQPDGHLRLARSVDRAKDQSYVLYMLDQVALSRILLPIGDLTKAEVRNRAAELGLRIAAKPDSQDVCFITSTGGRRAFLSERVELKQGTLRSSSGEALGSIDGLQLVTVGQRKGLGLSGNREPMYAVDVDVTGGFVTVGPASELTCREVILDQVTWAHRPFEGDVIAQTSAHGSVRRGVVEVIGPGRAPPDPSSRPRAGGLAGAGVVRLRWLEPETRVATGQSIALYCGDTVLGGGVVT